MIMRDDPPHPLPDTFFGIQLRGIGRLGLQGQPALGVLHDGINRCTMMLASAVMNHQQPFLAIAGQQLMQESRKLLWCAKTSLLSWWPVEIRRVHQWPR